MPDKPLSVRVPIELLDELDRIAGTRKINRKELVLSHLHELIDGPKRDEAMLVNLDRIGERLAQAETGLADKLTTGLAEINDRMAALEQRLDDLEEFQAHHLFNFLAYTAPDADETATAERGGARFVCAMRNIQAVKSGELPGLRNQAKAAVHDGNRAAK